jgi:tetratricopeptide (TPR) repeat protein
VVALAMRLLVPPPPAAPPAPALERLAIGYGPPSYAAALAEADRPVQLGRERVARRPQDWINQESLARALMARSRLTGSAEALAEAGGALALARGQAVAPSGPLLTSAAYRLATHRVAAIPADLDMLDRWAVPPSRAERAEAMALRGDAALYSGRYAEAERSYREAARIEDGASTVFRLAAWRKYRGDFAGAQAALARGAAMHGQRTPLFMASAYLQAGSVALVSGDWNGAERWFARADRAFPGHWLVQAHRAQMAAMQGDTGRAERWYRTSIAGSDAPEAMDALAALLRSQGRIAESRGWADRARTLWTERLRLLPEAYAAHAAEHELALGSPARALDLARRNHAARPYGDSATLLAAALLANGRAAEARNLIERLNRTPWRTAQQYVVLSQAHAMLGEAARSEAARAEAERLNPRAFHPAAALIWFGNH